MSAFLSEDFLLNSETARRLYHEHAATQPICDYHTHLSAADITSDRRFNNLAEIWLEGDHYKWRAMRALGMSEHLCSGDGQPYEKFMAWAATTQHTLRNPLYHWTHLELQRCFGITELLDVKTAPAIWKRANVVLQEDLSVRTILRKFRVNTLCTTDDPVDDLSAHRQIHEANTADSPFPCPCVPSLKRDATVVLPTFRPDRALQIDDAAIFLPWLESLREASKVDIRNLVPLLDALAKRHRYFSELGCRASDHGLERCPARPCTEDTAAKIFAKALDKQPIGDQECEQYATFLMLFFARLNAEMRSQWTMQLHLGARRNVNHRAHHALGPDAGFDAVGDYPQGAALATFLDLLTSENAMPQMVIYNSNPADNYVFATLAGSFQCRLQVSDPVTRAMQWGPPWWFLDQKQGMIEHLNCLSSVGLLSRFIGMTTDSRSFLSFPRHEYFRRILCDLIGGEVERGEMPNDGGLLGQLVEGICCRNAERYFGVARRNGFITGPGTRPQTHGV